MSDDIVARLRSHATGTTLCPTSRNLTAAAADEITRLRADLAAANARADEISVAARAVLDACDKTKILELGGAGDMTLDNRSRRRHYRLVWAWPIELRNVLEGIADE